MDPGEGTSRTNDVEMDQSIDCEPCVLDNWDEEEKSILLHALKIHGSKNLKAVSSVILTKTLQEVEEVVEYYKEKSKMFRYAEQAKARIYHKSKALMDGLNYWIDVLKKSFPQNQLVTNIGTALRIMAKYEKLPTRHQTMDISFREIYLAIADAIEGKLPRGLNNTEQFVLKNCVRDLVHEVVNLPESTDVDFWWHNPQTLIPPRPCPSSDPELATFDYLIRQRNVNPFAIDPSILKSNY